MRELRYQPVPHRHAAFLKMAKKRKGFKKAYDALEAEYSLIREMLAARSRSGLTQEAVAELMGTTKSAISRLEAAGKHAPSVATLRKYAQAVGCRLQIKFVPTSSQATRSVRTRQKLGISSPHGINTRTPKE
ncbi:MAG: helix-turn-helix transcriptional regulator [Candidatus Hydrogenedentes bacterium]|nr:helix-turn-helix transcriptional regulator [Candidatus Hydrogenedentota bacterium]